MTEDVTHVDLEGAVHVTTPLKQLCHAGSSEAVKLVFSIPTTPAYTLLKIPIKQKTDGFTRFACNHLHKIEPVRRRI